MTGMSVRTWQCAELRHAVGGHQRLAPRRTVPALNLLEAAPNQKGGCHVRRGIRNLELYAPTANNATCLKARHSRANSAAVQRTSYWMLCMSVAFATSSCINVHPVQSTESQDINIWQWCAFGARRGSSKARKGGVWLAAKRKVCYGLASL